MLALIDTHTVDRGVHTFCTRSGASYRWEPEIYSGRDILQVRDGDGSWESIEDQPRRQIVRGALMAYLGRVMRS